jgi:hypothetical protein
METNQVAMKYTQKQVFSYRKDPVYFTAGEWCMEEEANLDILL